MAMQFFGPVPWGLALDDPRLQGPAPIGSLCDWCGEPIAADDFGVTLPLLQPAAAPADAKRTTVFHRECDLRQVVGSVGHQRGRCSCYGGTEEDPPALTRRQAAQAAVAHFALIAPKLS